MPAPVLALLSLLAAITLLSGCSNPVLTREMEAHIIASDGKGDPQFYDCVDENGNLLDFSKDRNIMDYLAFMKENIRKSGRKKIMLYCFGGMNSVNETVEISAENTKIIMEDDPDIYPIFINWESALFDCYFNHAFKVRNCIETDFSGFITSPFYIMGDLVAAFGRLPENIMTQGESVWYGNSADLYRRATVALRENPPIVNGYVGYDYDDHTWMPLIKAVYVSGLPIRFLTTSLIDSFGSAAWAEMRRRVNLGFVKDPDFEASADNAVEWLNSPPDGVWDKVADMLLELSKENPDYEITMIGHCMGSFLVGEFVSRYPELPVRNIVYMAAASPIEETVSDIKPYLMSHPESHFYNLTLHPYIDEYDMMQFWIFPGGSALKWANDFLADPVRKDDYTVGLFNATIMLMPRMMEGAESQVTIKAFGILDPKTNTEYIDMPQQHTDFSSAKVKFWRKEFWDEPEGSVPRSGMKLKERKKAKEKNGMPSSANTNQTTVIEKILKPHAPKNLEL